MKRAYYSNSVNGFLSDDNSKILGILTLSHSHSLEDLQKNAWKKQIEILKESLRDFKLGHIYFEFAIPRMGKRVDNIIIIDDLIYVIEFKVGETKYDNYAVEQVVDYSLDLKNFHQGSHNSKLFPILLATNAESIVNYIEPHQDLLYKPLLSNHHNFSSIIELCYSEKDGTKIDPSVWENSIYKPTPTIVEAAQALYKGHNVKEISRSDSGAINLSKTANCINQIIDYSKKNNLKSICFLTGVPGAGKTLAGLNIATERMKIAEDEHAVFLSGNGPLVNVLREALTRDEVVNSKNNGHSLTKKEAAIKSNAFIQNIHHFRDDSIITKSAPIEKVVVFDEAQRAWTKEQAISFMKRKKGIDDFGMSEPEFLISVMDRHKDWCTIICLIGGGQEINTGEAGLEEWFYSLQNKFLDWKIYYSNLITSDINYLNNDELKKWLDKNGVLKQDLHLSVSVRSFRSEALSEFIENILSQDLENAKELYHTSLSNSYPIVITRNFHKAKKWLLESSRGSERFGITASSGGYRLRPFSINIKSKIDAPIWFLNNRLDVRSSYFMEDVATEFDIQGLELDWTCVAWDGDFYHQKGKWHYRKFKGTKWQNIKKEITKKYLLNAYRVLLTRARQGMVIFIPEGNEKDSTRLPKFYDGTYAYLKQIGIEEI